MHMEPSGKKEDCWIDKKKSIKHAQGIIELLEAVQLPENVAIMHIKAHQKVSSELEEEVKLVDRKAKEAAKGEVTVGTVEAALIPDEQIFTEGKPKHSKKGQKGWDSTVKKEGIWSPFTYYGH